MPTKHAAAPLFGEQRGRVYGRVTWPPAADELARRGVGEMHVEQLRAEAPPQGAGWQPRTVEEGRACVVVELERPGLVVQVVGVNHNSTSFSLDYAVVRPGERARS